MSAKTSPRRSAGVKIAVASQNRRQVTGHTGRCRRFRVYTVVGDRVTDTQLLDLPIEQTLHATSPHDPHPLDAVDVLISGGMGRGLVSRLAGRGIRGLITTETDPDRAVASFLAGALPEAVAAHSSR